MLRLLCLLLLSPPFLANAASEHYLVDGTYTTTDSGWHDLRIETIYRPGTEELTHIVGNFVYKENRCTSASWRFQMNCAPKSADNVVICRAPDYEEFALELRVFPTFRESFLFSKYDGKNEFRRIDNTCNW